LEKSQLFCIFATKIEKRSYDNNDKRAGNGEIHACKKNKQECIEALVKKMKEDYESKTGLQANYFFAM